jgi:hypothetical protein
MSLKLGQLNTILAADKEPLQKGLREARREVADAGEKMAKDAEKTGKEMGERLGRKAQKQLRGEKDGFARAGEQAGQEAGGAASEGMLDKLKTGLKGGALVVAAAVGVAFGQALAGALELDAAQAKLTAQMGDEAYAKELGSVAGRLYGKGFGESIDETMQAVRHTMSSGLLFEDATNEEIEAVTRKVQSLAEVFELDLQQAARAAGQMVRNGLAKDADEALDLITRGFQQTGDQAGDLLESMSEYSTQFRKLGLSGAEALGLMTQGVKAGARDLDVVADALKEFAIRSADGSKASAEGYKAIGLNAEKMTAIFAKGGPKAREALDMVLERIKAMKDPTEREAAAVALFGTKAEDLQGALMGLDLSTAEQQLGNVGGAAEKMADTLENSASRKVESFKRQVSQKLTELGGGIIGWAQEIASDPDVKDFMGDVERVLNERVLPALKEFFGWAEENVLPTLREIREDGVDKLREGWEYLSDKIEDNRDELEQVGQVAKSVAEWFIQDVLPVVYALYYHGFVKLAWGIGLVIDWIGFLVTAFRKGRDAVGWVGDKAGWLLGKLNDLRKKVSFSGMFDSLKSAFKSAINWVISKWNNLSFTLPKIGPFGGQTVSTPNIPMLARGGNILADGLAMVGEAGPELLHLPRGARVQPLQSGQAVQGMAQVIGVLRLIVSHPDGRVIKDELISAADLRGQSVSKYLGVT